MLSKLNGWKTYASSIATIVVVAILWKQGADVDTLVTVGIMGFSGGLAGLRHGLSKDSKKLDPADVVDLIEKAAVAKDKGSQA